MKNIENAKARYQRIKGDPAYQAKEHDRNKTRLRKRPSRIHTCPETIPCPACLTAEKEAARHKERLQTDRDYRDKYRAKERERNRMRAKRDGGAPGKILWIMVIGLLTERDGWSCHVCSVTVDWETASIDHLIPRYRNGTHDPNNLRLAHRRCNNRRNRRTP
jgi:5-methylcytosine-specific restriction endonuclease McrA